jgi:hypothetical protein
MINFIITDYLLKRVKKEESAPLRCFSMETHNFINNKCKYCGKTIKQIMDSERSLNSIDDKTRKIMKVPYKKEKVDDRLYSLNEI